MKKIYILISFLLISSFGFGQNWQRAEYNGSMSTSGRIIYHKNNLFVFNTAVDQLFKSSNRGQSWEQVTIPLEIAFLQSNDSLLFLSDSETLYRSNDAGITWEKLIENQEIRIVRVFEKAIVMGMQDGRVLLSIDTGNNFEEIYMNSEGFLRFIGISG